MTDLEDDVSEYIGQIQEFGEDGVHVSLWEFRSGKALDMGNGILSTFPAEYFPRKELNLGDKFRYYPAEGGMIKMLEQRDFPEIK